MQEISRDFAVYDLAELLLQLLEASSADLYDQCGLLLVKYVNAEWPDRKSVLDLAAVANEDRTETAWRAFADAILGLAQPDVLSDAFSLASDYFEATVDVPNVPPPVETNPYESLPFHRLGNSRLFEHLCYDWIEGLMPDAAVYLYGLVGQEQKGVDIVAFGSSSGKRPSRNAYFQCKLYKEFSKSDLTKAISKFEKNILVHKARSFVIITGCDVSDTKVLDEFEIQKQRLSQEYRITLVLLDGMRLTPFLGQNRRDLIHKYFGKAYDRPYLSVPRKAEDIGEQLYSIGGSEIFPADLDINGYEGLVVVKNQDVNIQIDLPDRFSHGPICGAITLRMLNHMQIGLGYPEVQELFSEVRVPLEDRPFIRGVIDDGQMTTTMMISGCRVYPTVRVAAAFAEAVDASYDQVLNRLREYDRKYETEGFQVVRSRYGSFDSSVHFRIASIDPMLWECIKDAVEDPNWDVDLQEPVAVLWDQRLHVITGPESRGERPRTDFYIYREENHWSDSLSVMWEPPPPGYYAEATNWWGALTAVQWFTTKLIPAAIKHREMRASWAWRNRPRWYQPWRRMEWVVIPRVEPYVAKAVYIQRLLDRANSVDELLLGVNYLQSFLHGEKRKWDSDHRRRIITALLICLRKAKLEPHNLRYITTKIYDAMTDYTHSDLIAKLEASLAESRVLHSLEGDYFLRAVGEMLDKADCPLSELDVREIAELVEPFARVHDDKLRLKLHTPPS